MGHGAYTGCNSDSVLLGLNTREKLLVAAEAALCGKAYETMHYHGLDLESREMRFQASAIPGFLDYAEEHEARCLYLCLLAEMETT